ncbi:MAG: right-handed parallel beta-helix repeat-containing protein, partial [Armatimonadetes bacterium]|nr:right-handed parallel beta-helix repeat-containing protein [Armatimonadota bacterium]
GFAAGAAGWKVADTFSTLSAEQAAAGATSLRVADTSTTDGSNVTSARVPVTPGLFELRAKVYPVSGTGLGIYVRAYDAAGKQLGRGDEFQRGAPAAPAGRWTAFSLAVYPPEETRFLEIWIHSYAAAVVTAYLDDFELVKTAGPGPLPPPWPPQYKLRLDETARLTAADVVGPDGLVYPDWTRAGVPGGIPDVPVRARAADYGGAPDDDRDDAGAILAAVESAARAGGGAVLLGPGVWHLDRPIAVRHDGIVLRGAGRDQTRVVFRYAIGPAGLRWVEPWGSDTLYTDSSVAFHASPAGLRQLELLADGQRVAVRDYQPHWGNTFSLQIKRQTGDPGEFGGVGPEAAVGFGGNGWPPGNRQLKLAADGKRGDTSLTLESVAGLSAGDWVVIEGPATARWKVLTKNACQWGAYRRNVLAIAAVEGNRVTLAEPLRIEFPTVDGSFVRRIEPLRSCGVEDLTIEQTEDLWTTTVMFRYARGCWARGVKVVKCGRFPVYGESAKQCEIRDCIFEDAWFKGGGGTAYGGWENSYDCLMTDCATYRLRHAPLVQWSASGNVIRNSTFVDSDMQWHSGWTNENLFENCVVTSKVGNGGYGFGAWASPPEDEAHGPNGPRNVVYHCDFRSPKTGLWMGGMNEGWMILYNRFVADTGQGVFAKTASFDHTVRGNVFALKEPSQPMLLLATPDCCGVEVYDNQLYGGNGRFAAGLAKPLVERGNVAHPFDPEPPRPQPAVESIYAWELAHVKR